MQSLGNILAMALKELQSLTGDFVLMALMLYSFTYAIYAVASNTFFEVTNAAIAIVDEDHSELSRKIADAFLTPYFKKASYLAPDKIDAALDAGDYVFVIDIPSGFERDLLADRRPEIQIEVDTTAMSMAGNGLIYAQNILSSEVAEYLGLERIGEDSPIRLIVRAAFNPNLDSTRFMAIMQLIHDINMLALIFTGAALIRERERGTIEHLLAMPVTAIEIILSKIFANGAVIFIGSLVSIQIVIRGLLDVPLTGSIGLFAFGLALYLFAMTALGIMIATIARSMPQLGLLSIPVFVVMNLLSGAMTPRESMPEWLQAIMVLAPSTYFVSFAQSVLFRNADIVILWPQLLGIGVIGTVFFLFALWRFRSSLEAQ